MESNSEPTQRELLNEFVRDMERYLMWGDADLSGSTGHPLESYSYMIIHFEEDYGIEF